MKTALITGFILLTQVLYVTFGMLILTPSHATTIAIGDAQTRAALALSKCANSTHKHDTGLSDPFSIN